MQSLYRLSLLGVAPLAAKRNVDFLKKYMGIDIKTLTSIESGWYG